MSLLIGKSLRLRAPEPEDLDLLYIWENDHEIWSVSNTLTPFSRFTLKSYIEASHQDIYEAKQLRLMIDLFEPACTIGTVDLFDFDPYNQRAGIGILIGDTSQKRKGYATEALDLLIEYCFSLLNFKQLYCNISAENINSIQLFEKAGFIQCGEKKEWLKTPTGWESELMFQLIRHK